MKAFDGFLITDDLRQLVIIECWNDSNEFRAILLDPGLIHLKEDVDGGRLCLRLLSCEQTWDYTETFAE